MFPFSVSTGWPKGTGIYAIRCSGNGRVYVGKSGRVAGISYRWLDHRARLRNGRHNNPILQRSFSKYGEAAFSFELLELCSVEALSAREDFWAAKLQSFDPKLGFNLLDTAPDRQQYVPSFATRRKLSTLARGRSKSPESVRATAEGRAKPFRLQSPDGVVHEGRHIKRFALAHGLKSNELCNVVNGHYRHHRGWTLPGVSVPRITKTRQISMVSPDGNLVSRSSVVGFCREFGLNRCCVSDVLHGRQSSHKGWTRGD